MLLSSMDHLNYYSMPKDGFLQLDGSGGAPDGYDLPSDDQYLNEENSPKNGTKSSLYKTELCKRFSEFGNCRYGAKCQFAHGLGELRHVVRHPKYKTTKCKSYWGSGHCPYGSRCRFIHEEVEGYATPQYSPQGAMGSMFGDVGGLGALGAVPVGSDLGGLSAASSSYLYGGGVVDHLAPPPHHHAAAHLSGAASVPSLPSYAKDYSLLASPFDKSAWGTSGRSAAPAHTKLTYAGEQTHHHQPQHHALQFQAPVPHHHHHHHSFSSSGSLQSVGPIGSLPLSSPTHLQQQSQSQQMHARHHHQQQTHHHHHMQAPAHAPLHRRHSSSGGSGSAAQASYPDLQDAIDALMKFSLTQDHEDDEHDDDERHHHASAAAVASSVVSTIATAPVGDVSVTQSGAVGHSSGSGSSTSTSINSGTSATSTAGKSKSDFALESDELWKDFPTSAQASVETLDTPSWSSSGLVLNLDTTKAFDVNEKKSGGSGSEHSPRLSVFERFH